MNNINFGKDIRELTEDELFRHVNNTDPKFGNVCQYELLRRLAIKNEKSAETYAGSSFYLSLVAIIISLGIGTVQIYLSI